MRIYFISNNVNDKDMEEKIEYINFDAVLIWTGYFPKNSCVWASYEAKGETASTATFQSLDRRFQLSKLGIHLTQSTILPETLIWDHDFDMLIVIGSAEELKLYISKLCVHLPEGHVSVNEFPDSFIYRLDCFLTNYPKGPAAKTQNRGFLYRGTN